MKLDPWKGERVVMLPGNESPALNPDMPKEFQEADWCGTFKFVGKRYPWNTVGKNKAKFPKL